MNLPLVAPHDLPRPPSVTSETLALLCRVVELVDDARVVFVDTFYADRHTGTRIRTAHGIPRDFIVFHRVTMTDPNPMLRGQAARWALEVARAWEVERAGDGPAWSRTGRLDALHRIVREIAP